MSYINEDMKDFVDRVEIDLIKNYKNRILEPLTDETAGFLVSALKRQIPRPVKYNNRHGDGADIWNKDYYNCPECGRRLRNKKPDPFCPRCGQALTWR